jgi:hypothetical protein
MYKYPIGKFRRMKMSHMMADTDDELHAMAQKIGVARKWYQGDHYDICMSMRAKAIKLGAKAITYPEMGAYAKAKREAWLDGVILPCV